MPSTANLLRYAEFSFGAYGTFDSSEIRPVELVRAEFTTTHAGRFVSDWRSVDQFEHSLEPYWIYEPTSGLPIGPYTATNGLSATVFENVTTRERVLAIRGTDDAADVASDLISVLALGSPKNQGQYQSLRTKVQEWIANGTLPQHFSVTGHSLGGFLATGLALEFPQNVDHAYLYNAPGLGGLTNRPVLDQIAHIYHITGGSYDPSKFTSVRARPGTSLISGLGTQPSPPILIEGEDHGGLLIGTNNHSIKYLVDSLAVHDAFGRFAGEDPLQTAGRIIRGSSDRELNKLEAALDALRITLQGGGVARTPEENRDELYRNLYALTDSAAYRSVQAGATIAPIANQGFESIASSTRGPLAPLVALRWLTPFQLNGAEAQLAAAHPGLQASLAHDASLSGTRLADADYSDTWRAERAGLLWTLVARNEALGSPQGARRFPVSRTYVDLESGTVLNTRPGDLRAMPHERIVFGREGAANTLTGTVSRDSLFGGFQSDTLDGGAGNDHVEGRRGSDVLRGGDGDDRLVGGEGVDQLFGDAGADRLAGGEGVDTLDGGAADDGLDGGLGADALRGGAGYDVYTIRSGEGKDTIADADGRGRIAFVDASERTVAIAGVGIADRSAANRWSVLIGRELEVVATRNSPLTLSMPDGTQVVVDEDRVGALGITLLPDIADQATTNTITGDHNTNKRDTLIGTAVNDRIDAGADADLVYGGTGADRILGGAGRDRLDGEAGDDVIEGGIAADIVEGGAGRDRLYADAVTSLDPLAALRSALASNGTPTNAQGDWLSGNGDSDLLIGGLDNDGLAGGEGADILAGGVGDDSLLGDAEVAPFDGNWSWSDAEVNGVLRRTFANMDDGEPDPAGGASDSLYGGAGNDFVLAGRGDDALYGDAGNDFLQGDAGADALAGGEGSDRLVGDGWATTDGADQGNDRLDGGAGDDRLTGGGAADDLVGGDGNDTLVGDDAIDRVAAAFHGADRLDGGEGNDALAGGFGNDEIVGGAGNDAIAGDLTQTAGGGDDIIDAGEGDDAVDAGTGNDRVVAGSGRDQVDGGEGHDEIAGGAGSDLLAGAAGDDLIEGGADGDELYGGDGLDLLDGGDGVDLLSGGDGDDDLLGAAGGDALHGDAGNDRLSGEDGADWLNAGEGNDDLNGGDGGDALSGGAGDDVLDGGGGRDLLMGGAGSDRFLLAADAEPDFLVDLDASDVFVVPEGVEASSLDFQRASDEFGNAGHLAILAGNQLIAIALDCPDDERPTIHLADGTIVARTKIDADLARHPTLSVAITLPSYSGSGSAAVDQLNSAGGDASLSGGNGNDVLTGRESDDSLAGGDGADTLLGAGGADTLTGGAGDDVLDAGDDADALDGGDGDDRLDAGDGDDVIAGGAGNDTLAGGAGADRLAGGEGNDLLDGGIGRDALAGDAGNDTLAGGEGNDALDGGTGNDTLSAGTGNDTLAGGAGDDLLDGGAGDDTFVLDGAGVDRVRDASGLSVVRFGAGITPGSITLARGAVGGADDGALVIDFGGGNRTIVEDGLRGGPASYEFDDGTVLTRAQFLDARLVSPLSIAADPAHRAIAGGAGTDSVSAGTASAVDLRGGSGADNITGSALADLLHGDAGNDHLTGHAGNDQLRGGAGSDLLDGGADNDLAAGGEGDDTFAPGEGDDTSFGAAGNDTFGFDAGNDFAFGGAGDDLYRFGAGANYDVIVDAEGANRVRLAPGVRPGDVAFRTDGSSLIAALADGSRLRMPFAVSAPDGMIATRIDAFDFDGETLTLAQALARVTPTTDADAAPRAAPSVTLSTTGEPVLDGEARMSWNGRSLGGPGDDTFYSGGPFLFGRGDGHDRLVLVNRYDRQTPETLPSWLEMAPGIGSSDVAFGIDGRDLVVTIRDTGDSVRVSDHFARVGSFPSYRYASALAGVRFADGSAIDFERIADAIGNGTDGDDHLGSIAVLLDEIHAGDGDDVVTLRDTVGYVFGGDGNDTLSADPYLANDASRLFGEVGDDVLVASGSNGAHTVLYGGEGDDRLVGHHAATLDGGPGSDRHELWPSATGDPIGIEWGRFSGSDSITFGDDDSAWSAPPRFTLRVSEFSYRDLVVERDNEDLVLRIRDRDDRIAVPDFFAAGAAHSGLEGVDIIQSGTELVYALSPGADEIAGRAVAVAAVGQTWAGTDASEVRVGAGGADALDGGAGNDEVDGMSGDDLLAGRAGDDTLLGRSGADTLEGGEGNDLLEGGRGDDTLAGGDGDDSLVDAFGDNAAEGGEGDDRIVLGGTRGIASGDAGNDSLGATSGEHLLLGGDGNDWLSAWSGTVELVGGSGDDTLAISAGTNAVVHFARGGGSDVVDFGAFRENAIAEIRLGAGIAPSQVAIRRDDTDLLLSIAGTSDSLRLRNGFSGTRVATPRIAFADGGALDAAAMLALARAGSPLDDVLVGSEGDDTMSGLDGDDRIDGRGGSDTLSGGAGADEIAGGMGGDFIDGGEGADAMAGGAGDDVYLIDDPGDSVMELAGEGLDEMRSTLTAYQPWNVERVRLLGGADVDAWGTSGDDDIAGNAGSNLLYAWTGGDRLAGGAGDDTYAVEDGGDSLVELANEGVDTLISSVTATLGANFEHLKLSTSEIADGTGNALDNEMTGGDGANQLAGLAGDDLLDGGGGADRLTGGTGNDRYVVDNAADVVVEIAGEGTDHVSASVSYVLPSDVENAILLGSAANLTGNALANALTGNAAANVLDGRGGADTMAGGAGNDTYVADHAGDTVTESAGAGSDHVQSSVSYVLGANVELLTLTGAAAVNGSGNTLANTLTGNAAANTLDGRGGNDTMRGGVGDDTYVVDSAGDVVTENASAGSDTVRTTVTLTLGSNLERLVLTGAAAINATGNTLANTLTGNAANNVLDGKAGADAMAGGAGNDTYVVDAAADTITENVNEGTDLVQSAIAWTLAANVENLTLTGTVGVNATGNALANALTGNAGNNVLDGKAGADSMRGAAGNDTYVVDNAADSVIESANAGVDRVQASVSWTLGANLENLTLTGTAAINGTGNTLANAIGGNAGANVLNGGAGADAMTGGAGDDVYVADNASDTTVEAAGAGTDRVEASVSWSLGANLEDLTLTGSAAINAAGNTLSNALAGNSAANVLTAADGNDLVWGAAGNDTLAGGNGNDVLQGGDGNDAIGDTAGNNLVDGGAGADTLTGGSGREFLAGGKGDDTISAGGGADVFTLNKGDGKDTIAAAAGADDVLSLGGGIRYADLGLKKVGNDLVLDAGADQVTLKDWYAAAANHRISRLQVVTDGSTDYLASSTDPTRNRRVTRFDFAEIVSAFDAARVASPSLTRWTVASALASAYSGGSDTAALGGDLAYLYGHSGNLAGAGFGAAGTILGDAAFAAAPQAFLPPATLAAGPRLLH